LKKEDHLTLTPQIKETQWGPGEWVNEDDCFEFEHEGFICFGIRMAIWEGWKNDHLSMGNWNGYIVIPENHPWCNVDGSKIECDVHWGLTFSGRDHWKEGWVIGFDCAHSGDLVPSIEHFKETDPVFNEMDADMKVIREENKKQYPEYAMFNPTYKNIDFVKNECRSLAHQAREAAK
jgi:hypothetical protein